MLQLNATLSHQINDLINDGPNYIKYHLQTFPQIISVVAKVALSILIAFPSRINIHSQPYLHWIINFSLFVYFPCSRLKDLLVGRVLTRPQISKVILNWLINIFTQRFSELLKKNIPIFESDLKLKGCQLTVKVWELKRMIYWSEGVKAELSCLIYNVGHVM